MHFSTTLIAAVATSLALSVNGRPVTDSIQPVVRIVGSLSCNAVKTGHLTLVNSKTHEAYPAFFDSTGQLAAYKGARSSNNEFTFTECTESKRPGFEDYPAKSKSGVYHGHLRQAGQTKDCVTATYSSKDGYNVFTPQECYYSDDSGSPFSYFGYDPQKDGLVVFERHTGPKGGYPKSADSPDHTTLLPGQSAGSPAIRVNTTDLQKSSWNLHLL